MVDVGRGNEQTTNSFPSSQESNRRFVVPKTYKGVVCLHMLVIYLSRFYRSNAWLEGKSVLELGVEIRGSRRIDC